MRLTPEVALHTHSTGYALDETHEVCVLTLCERFNLHGAGFEKALQQRGEALMGVFAALPDLRPTLYQSSRFK